MWRSFATSLRGAKPRSIEEAAFRVFDRSLSEGEIGPPLNRQELRARQDRFYADGRLRIEREAPHPERNVLVFVQCGQGFDAPYLETPRSYDVLLNYYQEGNVHPKADIAIRQAGTKTTAIRRLMELRPDLLLRYQAVLFLDDDVEIGAEGIEALFRAMAAEKLDLAQPALTADSATAYPFLKRPSIGAGVTPVSSVEIMAPALTRRALESASWAFAESVSGWGSDLLLGPAVRLACGPASVGGHRLGRDPAPSAGRSRRRRFLRLSAPLRRRSGARGQPDRGRLRRRTLSQAPCARRGWRDLPRAGRLDKAGVSSILTAGRAARTQCEGRTRPDFTH